MTPIEPHASERSLFFRFAVVIVIVGGFVLLAGLLTDVLSAPEPETRTQLPSGEKVQGN